MRSATRSTSLWPSDLTKLILFNSPMNPTATVFSRAELDAIATLVAKYDSYAICDEVYEPLAFRSDQVDPFHLADEPDGDSLQPRGTRRHRNSGRQIRLLCDLRRGLRASGLQI